ncbi:sigma 54 modulation/S30EA ribosomal C-terminal domain-containing protein [Streptomyces sp. BE303]|uniref:sigma 54 modulation/S30EA ribosomal C-terminal domain-containing protein n=1 Tax=Streptomyces sp. BE303 TaxID=3002528 RepID=UPI002E799603|nr:sigma 54 modulation/S30EA ribosomal C-terminal domain-containing protein [Streptomyces sp. BE303]MED7948464.1 sigma 54 modulation/S30EA ribosomal C-terminal domain-containing protein [Streptomyces sp. BE303]
MGELVTVRVCDGISRGFAADARARIAAVVSGADALVELLRVRVGPVGPTGVLAQVNAEVDGRRIRVQEVAVDLGEALDRLADGLRGRMAAVASGWAPRPWPRRARSRGPAAAPSSVEAPPAGVPEVRAQQVRARQVRASEVRARRWADPQAARTELPCAAGPQDIVRRKQAHLVWCSPDAAARTMDAMDFDIHLFTDPATETDAVVYRVGPTGYRLARTAAAGPPTRPIAPLTLSPSGAPELTEDQAVERLAAAELPYLFFAQPGSRRGRVLYRRFDGRLGLIAGAS